MDERGNMRLLLCDGLLAERPYQDLYVDTWWENSALRKWLNGVFVKECFAPEEGRNILNVRVETPASEEYYTNGGVNVSSHNGGVRPAMWVLLKG